MLTEVAYYLAASESIRRTCIEGMMQQAFEFALTKGEGDFWQVAQFSGSFYDIEQSFKKHKKSFKDIKSIKVWEGTISIEFKS